MSSLAGKMSLLVDEYNHSKTSPAYRKLNIKYKALKKSNQELIQLLTSLFAGSVNHDNIRRTSRRSQTCTDQTHAYQDDILEESQSDEDMEANFVPYDLPRNDTDDVEEEEERDLESCRDEENESEDEEGEADCDEEGEAEDEEGEADCDEEEETEDPDIKEQIIQEQVAESFAIKEEEQQTVTVEEEETEEIVEYEEVEETEEEVVEYEEVEETEEVEVEEEVEEDVVEYEEVEETEEEEEEVEEEEEEEVEEEEEEEEAGVYEIDVNGTRYYTTNEKDGIVYALLEDDDVGDEVGKFVNGKLVLN
jgi:hypothetical protein